MNKVTHSSSKNIAFSQKIRQFRLLFVEHLRRTRSENYIHSLFIAIDEYEQLLKRYSHKSLSEVKILEVGYGARPYRMLALFNLGCDIVGIDMDKPVLSGHWREFMMIYQRNGLERSLKSLARFVLFDARERRNLSAALKKRGAVLKIDTSRFLVGDAAKMTVPKGSIDLIISEDVVEHIPMPALESAVTNMANALKPDGLAFIRPTIFTGITGNHLVEWFQHNVQSLDMERKSEPWEHLRKKRYQADTYLNQLSRAQFRELFGKRFDILEERVQFPDLGREYLSPAVRDELSAYDEEELFSNQVMFVLRKKACAAH